MLYEIINDEKNYQICYNDEATEYLKVLILKINYPFAIVGEIKFSCLNIGNW